MSARPPPPRPFSTAQFAFILYNIHKDGNQDQLNAHIKPQSRVCFKDGATPDKWDRVTTGYDAEALKELGEHLGVEGLAPEDGGARRTDRILTQVNGEEAWVGLEHLSNLCCACWTN